MQLLEPGRRKVFSEFLEVPFYFVVKKENLCCYEGKKEVERRKGRKEWGVRKKGRGETMSKGKGG